VAERVGVPLDLRRREGRFCLPERVEHELLHRRPVGLARDNLDQAAEQRKPGVVVAEERSERSQLRGSSQALNNVAGDRIIRVASIEGIITPPPAGMGQQVTNRCPGGDVLVHEPKIGQVGADGGVEVELALVD
jgi:hypothetical protein